MRSTRTSSIRKKTSSLDSAENSTSCVTRDIAKSGASASNCSLQNITNVRVRLSKLPLVEFNADIDNCRRRSRRKQMSDEAAGQTAISRRRRSGADQENISSVDGSEESSPVKKAVKTQAEISSVNNTTADEKKDEAMQVDDDAQQEVKHTSSSDITSTAKSDAEGNSTPGTSKPSTSGISLKSQTAKALSKPTQSTDQLVTLFSNIYLNSVGRLCADFPPRCAEDLVFCREHHYHKPGPDVPSESLKIQLRCTLQQQGYESFANLAMSMCQRREFPGEDTFTMIIELLLSINHTSTDKNDSYQFYDKCIELFSCLVRTFPPCWRAMRSAYIGFFQRPLDTVKINSESGGERLSRSTKIFDIVLDLLERELKEYSTATLSSVITPDNSADEVSPTEFNSPFPDVQSQWEFGGKNHVHTYIALNPAQRLTSLFVVMRLLLQILEHDFIMWLLHHYRKNSNWIFYNDSRPLVVFVLGMSEEAYLSATGRQIFNIFAIAVNKGVAKERLQVLERYIALLMVVSNTADIEHTVLGVKYPQLGVKTKQLIGEFFKKFKEQNLTTSIASYISAIELLRIPYVRYTFIDQFLQMFDFTQTERFAPEKVLYVMKRKHWLKHKPEAELLAIEEDELSREQYLKLLLDALRHYCEWRACHEVLQLITSKKIITSIKISTDSVHRSPTPGGGLLMLEKITEDIGKLEQQLRMKVRMSKPKIELPRMDMCIDKELIRSYRNDLKCLNCLQQMLYEQSQTNAELDLSRWLEFLGQYKET